MTYKWLFTIIAFFAITNAQAIVNMEDLHLGSVKTGFSGNLQFSVSGETGNTEKIAASLGGRLQLVGNKNTDFLVANLTYGESKRIKDTQKSFLHARHIYQHSTLLAIEGFGQMEQNKFVRLTYRGLIGMGARLTLPNKSSKHEFHIGLGGFYAHERLTEGTVDSSPESFFRANTYAVLKILVNENVHFLSSTYYQPILNQFSDYRLLETMSCKIKMTENFDLTLNLVVVHDSNPPLIVESNKPDDPIEKTDITYNTGLIYTF